MSTCQLCGRRLNACTCGNSRGVEKEETARGSGQGEIRAFFARGGGVFEGESGDGVGRGRRHGQHGAVISSPGNSEGEAPLAVTQARDRRGQATVPLSTSESGTERGPRLETSSGSLQILSRDGGGGGCGDEGEEGGNPGWGSVCTSRNQAPGRGAARERQVDIRQFFNAKGSGKLAGNSEERRAPNAGARPGGSPDARTSNSGERAGQNSDAPGARRGAESSGKRAEQNSEASDVQRGASSAEIDSASKAGEQNSSMPGVPEHNSSAQDARSYVTPDSSSGEWARHNSSAPEAQRATESRDQPGGNLERQPRPPAGDGGGEGSGGVLIFFGGGGGEGRRRPDDGGGSGPAQSARVAREREEPHGGGATVGRRPFRYACPRGCGGAFFQPRKTG